MKMQGAWWLVLAVGVLSGACGDGRSAGDGNDGPGPSSEICGNSSDDDGDGAVDCLDADCRGQAACGVCNGNGVVDGAEVCDGAALNGLTCKALGFDSGTLACATDCRAFDSSACVTSAVCGDGQVEGPEECDGSQLRGLSCVALGFTGGVLGCAACELDLQGCTGAGATCGDGARTGLEVCDGALLGGESCASLGYSGGTLGCNAGCAGFDTSGCTSTCVPTSTVTCDGPDETLFQQGLTAFNAVPPDYVTACDRFDTLWTAYPASRRHDNAGYMRGRCRYEQGDLTGALLAFAQLRAEHPQSLFLGAAAYFAGRAYYKLANFTAALAEFDASIALDPAGTFADNARYYAGRCAYELQDFATAATDLGAFVASAAGQASTYYDNAAYYLGRSHLALQAWAQAIDAFTLVIGVSASIYRDNAYYYRGRAHLGLDGGGPTDAHFLAALADFEALLAEYPVSQYADNALSYEARAYTDHADCAHAQAKLGQLQSSFPASALVSTTQSYVAAGGC